MVLCRQTNFCIFVFLATAGFYRAYAGICPPGCDCTGVDGVSGYEEYCAADYPSKAFAMTLDCKLSGFAVASDDDLDAVQQQALAKCEDGPTAGCQIYDTNGAVCDGGEAFAWPVVNPVRNVGRVLLDAHESPEPTPSPTPSPTGSPTSEEEIFLNDPCSYDTLRAQGKMAIEEKGSCSAYLAEEMAAYKKYVGDMSVARQREECEGRFYDNQVRPTRGNPELQGKFAPCIYDSDTKTCNELESCNHLPSDEDCPYEVEMRISGRDKNGKPEYTPELCFYTDIWIVYMFDQNSDMKCEIKKGGGPKGIDYYMASPDIEETLNEMLVENAKKAGFKNLGDVRMKAAEPNPTELADNHPMSTVKGTCLDCTMTIIEKGVEVSVCAPYTKLADQGKIDPSAFKGIAYLFQVDVPDPDDDIRIVNGVETKEKVKNTEKEAKITFDIVKNLDEALPKIDPLATKLKKKFKKGNFKNTRHILQTANRKDLIGDTTTLTNIPTKPPTRAPTKPPTRSPTTMPTTMPSTSPTTWPTKSPTRSPSGTPTAAPTPSPTDSPTGSCAGLDIYDEQGSSGYEMIGRSANCRMGLPADLYWRTKKGEEKIKHDHGRKCSKGNKKNPYLTCLSKKGGYTVEECMALCGEDQRCTGFEIDDRSRSPECRLIDDMPIQKAGGGNRSVACYSKKQQCKAPKTFEDLSPLLLYCYCPHDHALRKHGYDTKNVERTVSNARFCGNPRMTAVELEQETKDIRTALANRMFHLCDAWCLWDVNNPREKFWFYKPKKNGPGCWREQGPSSYCQREHVDKNTLEFQYILSRANNICGNPQIPTSAPTAGSDLMWIIEDGKKRQTCVEACNALGKVCKADEFDLVENGRITKFEDELDEIYQSAGVQCKTFKEGTSIHNNPSFRKKDRACVLRSEKYNGPQGNPCLGKASGGIRRLCPCGNN